MISVTFPDGASRAFPPGTSGLDSAKSISPSLAKRTATIVRDDVVVDLAEPIEHDARIEFITRESPRALTLIRHDAAHVLAEAAQALYPGTQVTIGTMSLVQEKADHAAVETGRAGSKARDRLQRLAIAELRVTLDAAERERGLLRQLVYQLPDLLFVKDTQSRFLTANRATALDLRYDDPTSCWAAPTSISTPPPGSGPAGARTGAAHRGRTLDRR